MSMISFGFFGLVAVVFVLLFLTNKIFKDDNRSIKISNIVLLVAGYLFVAYADWRFAAVLALLTLSTWFCAGRKRYIYSGTGLWKRYSTAIGN